MLNFSNLLIGYIGPETIIPLTSVIAAISGFFMLFWSTLRGMALWMFRRSSQNKADAHGDDVSSSHV